MAFASSSRVTAIRYDVFISFRGDDVRRGFLSHLRKELRRWNIHTYVDEQLDKGDEISSSLDKAIEESLILLVIFSKDYASSKWCLEELAKMIECMETNKQTVIPVFFEVDPSYVRHQRGAYGDALAHHEEKLKKNMLKVQSWRSALKKAADLSGFHYPTNFENESDLVDRIVELILKKLSMFRPSEESKGLVGIDQSIANVESLFKKSEVTFVGLWGMGGIGKTTLARALFEKYSLKCDGCCFLNVSEQFKDDELKPLKEKLISELLEEQTPHRSGISKERFFFSSRRMMIRKKVLIVLDNVTTSEQLKYLIGEPNCFGESSIVIITSRDRRVLTSGGVHQIYQVKEMDPGDSLKLFCSNASNKSHPKKGYEKLTEEVVKVAQGNPLALKVLGLDFHSRPTDTWQCALSKIKKYPNEKIQSVLRFSYNELDEVEKKAFLDITLFFREDDKDYVIRLLDAWGFYGASSIDVLQQKALITISKDNRIQMHDFIREMGFEIVRQESTDYPGRRSRLRVGDEEEYSVLRNNLGTDAVVEAMQIDVSRITNFQSKIDTLKKMPHLRFLIIHNPMHKELSMPTGHVKALLEDIAKSKSNNMLVKLPQFFLATDGESSSAACDPVLSLQKQVRLLLSGWINLIGDVASEIHIKFVYYFLIDGTSSLNSKLSVMPLQKERKVNKVKGFTMEILNSSMKYSKFSDPNDVEFKHLQNVVTCLRAVYYVKVSKSTEQDIMKPKLRILFDGLKYHQQITFFNFVSGHASFRCHTTCGEYCSFKYSFLPTMGPRVKAYAGRLRGCNHERCCPPPHKVPGLVHKVPSLVHNQGGYQLGSCIKGKKGFHRKPNLYLIFVTIVI